MELAALILWQKAAEFISSKDIYASECLPNMISLNRIIYFSQPKVEHHLFDKRVNKM